MRLTEFEVISCLVEPGEGQMHRFFSTYIHFVSFFHSLHSAYFLQVLVCVGVFIRVMVLKRWNSAEQTCTRTKVFVKCINEHVKYMVWILLLISQWLITVHVSLFIFCYDFSVRKSGLLLTKEFFPRKMLSAENFICRNFVLY